MPKKESNSEEIAVFKALADESRLKIISILLEKDSYTEYLASRLNLTPPTITYHMNKLEKAGIVFSTRIQHYIIYSINAEMMEQRIGDFIKAVIQYDDSKSYEEKVIDNFFEYGRLKSLPTQIKKREIVVGYIASKFEMNRTYTEKELKSIILDLYDDYCTVKRDLIGMGFIEDLEQNYKRIK